MYQNTANPSSRADQHAGFEELRRHISQAREQAQSQLGSGEASHQEEQYLETVASMLAQAEGLLGQGSLQPSTSNTYLSSTPRSSALTPAVGSGSTSTSGATQVSPLLSSLTSPDVPVPTRITAPAGLRRVVSLNSYSEPAIPSDRLTFSYLWKLWALQDRKTRQDVPALGVDLQLLALNINLLGGQAELDRDPSLWKRLAVQLKLIEDEVRNDENSKRIVGMLQKTQEELLLPFEQYCVAWSRLSEEDKNKILMNYAAATKSTKANLPSSMPEVSDIFSQRSATPASGSATALAPNLPELHEAIKLVDTYFYGFYPGIQLHTKIERLLKLPPSELPNHIWTRKRLNWLSKFSQNHADRSTDQIIAYMAIVIQQQLRGKGLAPMPPSGWPARSVQVTEVLPPTSTAMFSPSLTIQANQFVERTLQAIEEVRYHMRRVELLDAHQQPLRALVTEAYDLALFFYRAVALHYMLFLNEKETRSTMMHAMLIIEQFFLSSTGYPTHIMTLKNAVAAVTHVRDAVNSMRDAHEKRYRDYLSLKAQESRGTNVQS
ncbi:hypothetical protein B0J17DRAFT_626374 [Rhizoctonia solani]|nr:hypothetical protein B0J17DRAFT_626374 [Rhizoctonia solani]